MSFKDKYPRICPELCPLCKRTCMHKMEKHVDADGNYTAHVCGPHWWITFKVPARTSPFEVTLHGESVS